jgi:hypothetical protein
MTGHNLIELAAAGAILPLWPRETPAHITVRAQQSGGVRECPPFRRALRFRHIA